MKCGIWSPDCENTQCKGLPFLINIETNWDNLYAVYSLVIDRFAWSQVCHLNFTYSVLYRWPVSEIRWVYCVYFIVVRRVPSELFTERRYTAVDIRYKKKCWQAMNDLSVKKKKSYLGFSKNCVDTFVTAYTEEASGIQKRILLA